MGGLAPGAHLARHDKLPDVGLQGGPPEAASEEETGPGYPRMAGKLTGVAPLENPAPDRLRDEEAIPRADSRDGMGALGRPDSRLETPGDYPHYPGGGKDGLGAAARWIPYAGEQARQGIGPHILRAGTVSEGKVKLAEHERPARLPRTQPLRIPNVCQVLVVASI